MKIDPAVVLAGGARESSGLDGSELVLFPEISMSYI